MNTPSNKPERKHDSNPENRDPISKEPGAHPIGTGTGAVVGGVAGGAIGSTLGPVGAALGATAGAVAGGYAGRAAGEAVNPTEQEAYWKKTYPSRPYAKNFRSYEEVAPAYRYGWESASSNKYKGRSFADSESTLRNDWEKVKGKAETTWDKAKDAVRDAWQHVAPGRHD